MAAEASATAPTSAVFTAALALTEAAPEHLDLAFTAVTQPCPWPKAYGGDMVAQAAAAAMRSVTDGKALHSLHSYFLRPVAIGARLRYEVEVLRNGRGYSTRQVRGYADGKAVYACLASFAAADASGAADWPSSGSAGAVPGPERLPSAAQYLAGRSGGSMTDAARDYWSVGRGFDLRHVPGPVYLEVEGGLAPHQAVWVRPFDPLRPVAGLTAAQRDMAALAYVCDYTILEPVLRVLGLPWARPGLTTASLDHAMWFHRPADGALAGWILYAQEAAAAGHGRGTGIGRLYAADPGTGTRRHLATVVQEGMIRQEAGA